MAPGGAAGAGAAGGAVWAHSAEAPHATRVRKEARVSAMYL